jgi:hypothetical protein
MEQTPSTVIVTLVAEPGNVAGMAAGGDPASLASGLLSQADAFSQLGQLSNIGSLLQRASTNITSAATGLTGTRREELAINTTLGSKRR